MFDRLFAKQETEDNSELMSELERLKEAKARSDLLDEACGIGLWEAVMVDGDAMHPESKWLWSPEFRRLLGFETDKEFPNVVQSWSDRLHPDDVEPTFKAFAGHLEDLTDRTRYDVTYRLRMKDGSYRWFRATGGCRHLEGGLVRACGSLSDIHEAKTLQERIEREAEEDRVAIDALAEGLEALARGDLTYRITAELSEKTERLKDNFNSSVAALSQTITEVLGSVSITGRNASEIREAAETLSERSMRQASSIEETSTTLAQISKSLRGAAENAKEARDVALNNKSNSDECGQVVQEAVEAMEAIEKSAAQIGGIIGTIESIAFQTNLLALNASVEAARAGEAGKGFAVVASEVRGLAQRSSEAAQEITTLIKASNDTVSKGVSLVKRSGTSIETIASEIARISGFISHISEATNEQSTGLGEIERAVVELDQMIQQNTQMSEQNLRSAGELSTGVETLAALLDKFALDRAKDRSWGATPAARTYDAALV